MAVADGKVLRVHSIKVGVNPVLRSRLAPTFRPDIALAMRSQCVAERFRNCPTAAREASLGIPIGRFTYFFGASILIPVPDLCCTQPPQPQPSLRNTRDGFCAGAGTNYHSVNPQNTSLAGSYSVVDTSSTMSAAGSMVQRACSFCRKRKLRCDRQLPRCQSCVRLGHRECDYVAPKPGQHRQRPERSHVQELEERLSMHI